MDKLTCQSVPRVLMVLGAFIALWPAPAWACSRLPGPPTLDGQPANNDEAVPTNVVMHYVVPPGTVRFDDPPDTLPGEYTLRSALGEQVPLLVTRPAEAHLVLTPTQPLQPNTAYTLDAHWRLTDNTEADATLTFKTSDGPLDETPAPPSAVLRHYELKQHPMDTCGPARTGSCVSVQDDQRLIEYTLVDDNGEEARPSLVRGSLMMSAFGKRPDRRFGCVDVRHFGANGIRSQPLRLCADDAPVSDLSDLLGEPNVGCAATGLDWCDSTGAKGNEPGPDDPRGVDGVIFCPLMPTIQSGESVQSESSLLSSDAGATPEPAANGCSAAPTSATTPRSLSLFAVLAGLGLLHLRRRAARATAKP